MRRPGARESRDPGSLFTLPVEVSSNSRRAESSPGVAPGDEGGATPRAQDRQIDEETSRSRAVRAECNELPASGGQSLSVPTRARSVASSHKLPTGGNEVHRHVVWQ